MGKLGSRIYRSTIVKLGLFLLSRGLPFSRSHLLGGGRGHGQAPNNTSNSIAYCKQKGGRGSRYHVQLHTY